MPIELYSEKVMLDLPRASEVIPSSGPSSNFRAGTIHQASAAKAMSLLSSLGAPVVDPSGDRVLKISAKEWKEKYADDPEFTPRSQYWAKLALYPAGTPKAGQRREKPLRPLMQNEVGMYRGKIVFLTDAGYDDYGEGKYYVVGVDLKPAEEPAIVLAKPEDLGGL